MDRHFNFNRDRDYAAKVAKSMYGKMTEQLKAAKASGEPVYLAVSDAIGDGIEMLRELLARDGLADTTVFTFPESKLKETAATLRTGLGLAAGVALVTADDLAEVEDDAD